MEDARGVPEAQSAPLSFSEESIVAYSILKKIKKSKNPINSFSKFEVTTVGPTLSWESWTLMDGCSV
jgi:hypothetical protein